MSLDRLEERRKKMALKFIKKSVKQETYSRLFPFTLNNHLMKKRNPEKYAVSSAKTERYRRSAVPFFKKLLNEDYDLQKKNIKCLLQVNNDVINNVPITQENIHYIIIIIIKLIRAQSWGHIEVFWALRSDTMCSQHTTKILRLPQSPSQPGQTTTTQH